MIFYYNGDHNVLFKIGSIEYDSWKDWFLIPKSRPVISPALERTSFITIPGRNGKVDVSWAFTDKPVYDNRTGSFEFYVDVVKWHGWQTAYRTITNLIQGRRLNITLGDDPSFYYTGLCWVSKWSSDERNSLITLQYDLEPFRKRVLFQESSWVWDTFDFENGVIGVRPSGEEELL